MYPKIIYEDNHIIAVEKAPGIPTQGDITGISSLLDITREYIKNKYNKPGNVFLGMMHRLDKPVSGLIVFARTSKAAARLTLQFQSRYVTKMYLALVEFNNLINMNEWTGIEQTIRRHRGYSEITDDEDVMSKDARLEYYGVASNEKYALVLINLLTGRKHQIRAQFSSLGMPILGDTQYGSRQSFKDQSICLHSYYMRFTHPTQTTQLVLRSSIPYRFNRFFTIDNIIKDKIQMLICAKDDIGLDAFKI